MTDSGVGGNTDARVWHDIGDDTRAEGCCRA